MNKNLISIEAKVVWQLLHAKGTLSMREIGIQTKINEINLGFAIGWLVQENKVHLVMKDRLLYVELVDEPNEIYY